LKRVKGAELEDYLTTVYRLEEVYGVARTTQVAAELSVSPATVAKMLSLLERRGLVERKKYRGVKLTEAGRREASRLLRKHRIAEAFLVSFLGFNHVEAHAYAHALEHVPDEVLERIHKKVGGPSTCPHGNEIPGEAGPSKNAKPLRDVELGAACKVSRIAGELLKQLEKAYELGLAPGVELKVVGRSKRGDVVVEVEGRLASVPRSVAEVVFVEVGEK